MGFTTPRLESGRADIIDPERRRSRVNPKVKVGRMSERGIHSAKKCASAGNYRETVMIRSVGLHKLVCETGSGIRNYERGRKRVLVNATSTQYARSAYGHNTILADDAM